MLDILLRASIGGAVAVALVWLVNRVLPGLSPATRATLWWCAAAKFLVALVWTTPVLLPVLPPSDSTLVNVVATSPRVDLPEPSAAVAEHQQRSDGARSVEWTQLLLAIWIVGASAAFFLGGARWRSMRRAIRRSSDAPAPVHAIAQELAQRLGLKRTPAIRLSKEVRTPLVAGVVQPIIILPIDRLSAMSARQLRMTLCHELVHVKRLDLWAGCLPALAERLFFFHPAAHLAAREYLFWREAACDAAVLDAVDVAPQEYGRLLLDLGVARRSTTLAAAGAPWSFSVLKRRIAMLHDPSARSLTSRVLTGVVLGLSLVAIVPFQLSARAPLAVGSSADDTRELAPPVDERPRSENQEEKLNFVLFVDEHRTTMSGQVPRDINRAKRFKQGNDPLLWFRTNGREYIVRDQAVLRDVVRVWDEVGKIGDEQGKVGGKQGEIGAKQGELGSRQGEIGLEQGRIGAEQGRVGTRQGQLAAREGSRNLSDAERADIEKERRSLDARMRQLDEEMRKLDARMKELDDPMRELNDRMRVLDREMASLGEKMEAAQKRAETEMRAILESAIAKGLAESVK